MLAKRNLGIVIFIIAVFAFTSISAFAAYGDYKTVTVYAKGGWQGGHSSGPSDKKESDSGSWKAGVAAKTMTSHPQVKLVNSDNETRSGTVSINNGAATYTGGNNTGTKSYNYWGRVSPAWNQVGTDTIKFRIQA